MIGPATPSTISLVIRQLTTVSSEGISYICSMIVFSMIARSPLAPVFLVIASFAISRSASSSKINSTPSNSNSFLYCLQMEFFGSDKICTNASSSRRSNVTLTGTRPINSGIRPYFTKSSGNTCFKISPTFLSEERSAISALKPMDFLPIRLSIIFSIPSNAPPQIKRIFVVSI